MFSSSTANQRGAKIRNLRVLLQADTARSGFGVAHIVENSICFHYLAELDLDSVLLKMVIVGY